MLKISLTSSYREALVVLRLPLYIPRRHGPQCRFIWWEGGGGGRGGEGASQGSWAVLGRTESFESCPSRVYDLLALLSPPRREVSPAAVCWHLVSAGPAPGTSNKYIAVPCLGTATYYNYLLCRAIHSVLHTVFVMLGLYCMHKVCNLYTKYT